MKIDLNAASYEGKWVQFGEAKLFIRPYPASKADVAFKGGAMIVAGEDSCEMFCYCLQKWENVTDAQGQELKLTEEVKRKIYDFRMGRAEDGMAMADYVIRTARQMAEAIEGDAKN